MRKALYALIVPLVTVAVMTAAVSAFESHVINVEAHVSNSLTVPATSTTIGTKDTPKTPLAWQDNFVSIEVELSQSFVAQSRVSTVDYRVCAQAKPLTHPGTVGLLFDGFDFLWMGGSAFLEIDPGAPPDPNIGSGPFFYIGPSASTNANPETGITPPAGGGVECPLGAEGSLTTLDLLPPAGPDNLGDTINLWWEPPVFQEFYDPNDTSPGDSSPKPRNDDADCGTRLETEPCVILTDPPAKSQGTPLGLDLVIQVTNIQ